jgi:Tfp pilus assembly protein PilF
MTVPSSFRTSPQPPLRFPLPGVKGDFPQAKAAATRALEIDDSLGEAPLALARVIQLYDWDWLAVEMEYRRALELNPNDTMAYNWYGEYLQEMGRNEGALAQSRQAMVLDPLSSDSENNFGDVFYTARYAARQYDQVIRAFQKALELERTISMQM